MSHKLEDKFDGWSDNDAMQTEVNMSPENSGINSGFENNEKINANTECPVEAEYCPIFHVHSEAQVLSDPEQENPNHSKLKESRCDLMADIASQELSLKNGNDDSPTENHQKAYRESYNPRLMSSPPPTVVPRTGQAMQIDMKGDEGSSHRVKNYVLDYRNLRKSGYFLSCQKKKQDTSPILMDPNLRFAVPRADQVKNWLNNLPDDIAYLKELDDDFMRERELERQLLTPRLPFSEEENFKHFILNNHSIKYTFEPNSTLSYKEVERILEIANSKIDDYLEKLHKTLDYVEQEYVKGEIEIPEFFKRKDDQPKVLNSQGANVVDSWFDRLKKWMSTFGKNEEELRVNCDSFNKISECQIVLEPYHGPVSVNGAIIESGTTRLILGKGILGTVVEEIKAALQAINQALRRIPLHGSRSAAQVHPGGLEDPEVVRLTEMLQTKEFRKKPTFRTVFGLRNTDKIPPYAFRFQRRRLHQYTRRRNFLRAVNGWIHRKNHGQISRQRYRILTSSSGIDRVPLVGERRTASPRGPQDDPGIGRLITGMMSAIRTIVPFHPSPGIPVAPAQDQQSRPPRTSSTHDAPLVIPTRYQILRNSSRSNMKTNKVKKIHVVSNGN